MVRRMQVVLEDDIDGGEANRTVAFVWEGIEYEIDLNEKNAEKFGEAMKPWVTKARRVGGRRKRIAGASESSDEANRIREWARDNGYKVSNRGRISLHIREAYAQAH